MAAIVWYRFARGRALTACSLAVALLVVSPGGFLATAAQAQSVSRQQFDIPAGPLSSALARFAGEAGVLLTADAKLTQGRSTPGLKGAYTVEDGLRHLLAGSGLEAVGNSTSGFSVQKEAAPRRDSSKRDTIMSSGIAVGGALPDLVAPTVSVTGRYMHDIGPMPGLQLTKEQIPGNVQTITAEQIKQAHAVSLADLMNSHLQSVNVNDYQSNPFQMDVTYRGFTASPQLGTPQGLSVFFDGIRVNEPFGDVVNWDMIPMNALASFDVFPGSNPIFGLNTLGGALVMRTKNGFDNPGGDIEVLAGSFGRKQFQPAAGWNNGVVGLFAAGNFFMEDGWRDNSPSKVNQMFGKATYRTDKFDLNFSTLYTWTDLVGNGLVPSQMYDQSRTNVFSSPDTTQNKLLQFQLSGSYFVSDTFSITGQAYRRNSKRKSLAADVYTEHQDGYVRRKLDPGEQYTCLYNSSNKYGLPDYYVVALDQNDWFNPAFPEFYGLLMDFVNTGVFNPALLSAGSFNQDLPTDFAAAAQYDFNIWKNYHQALFYGPQADDLPTVTQSGPATSYSNGEPSFTSTNFTGGSNPKLPQNSLEPFSAIGGNYYYTADGVKHAVMMLTPFNGENCQATQNRDATSNKGELSQIDPKTGGILVTDGAGTNQPGVVEGTPTAILTNTEIDQIINGASIQFNWNLERHKFMVGASLDSAHATYTSGAMLGLLDAQRNAYIAPDQIREQYAAAYEEVHNNDFGGTSLTKSLYASETWSPVDTWNFTGAVRYNDTQVRNTVATRARGFSVFELAQYEAYPDFYNICVNGVCPTTGYKVPDLSRVLNKPETEKFSYYSLNPSLGATWQAMETLNLFANVARGTRTPSVIELGCALDHTLVDLGPRFENGVIVGRNYLEASLLNNRSCSLPSTLSGDPFLPQIKAQTIDLGVRGKLASGLEWNVGVYRTDLKDDIYLITYPGNKNFFDSIGDTRRQGIEAGIAGGFGKFKFRLNYALTDATFQSSFRMASPDNSSASFDTVYCNSTGTCQYSSDPTGRIQVKPGDRMPGVPLHNLNATVNYDLTPAWQVGLTAIAHSSSYVRGNENNEHQAGVSRTVNVDVYDGTGAVTHQQVTLQPTTNPGTVPGYVVFNFQTSYKVAKDLTLGLIVSNIFDTEYFSAGRLGRNPFSPSIYGAIGPDGYNHNSSDWLSANFLSPGAPRAAWVSLTYEFGTK